MCSCTVLFATVLAKCIQSRIYHAMNVPEKPCKVSTADERKDLDKGIESYLKFYKNMNKSNVSRIPDFPSQTFKSKQTWVIIMVNC